jgi:DUF1680 family protein
LTLNREWHRGNTVKISMDIAAAVVHDPHDERRVALRRGPQLLALGQPGNPEHLVLAPNAASTLKDATPTLIPNWPTRFRIAATENGASREITLMPFADSSGAGIWFASGT